MERTNAIRRIPSNVSVVMPVYNAAPTLLRALESIRAQTTPPKEVICIDDGSTDNSAELIRNFDSKNTFDLRCIQLSHNQGVASARNHGLDAATGQFIAFLDADDVWSPEKLNLQLRAMEEFRLDLLGGHSGILNAQQGCPPATEKLYISTVSLMAAMFSNPWHTSSVVVRRDACEHFSESGHLSEDYGLWLHLLASKRHCASHRQPVSFMFKQAYGASGLSAQLLKMQHGEITALTGIGVRYHPLKIAIAVPFSGLKFFWRLSKNSLLQNLRRVRPPPPCKDPASND